MKSPGFPEFALSVVSAALLFGAPSCFGNGNGSDLSWLDVYNVAWSGPGRNSGDSMPCGGGDIGLNVWVEGGDLVFYADRSGDIDENDQQLKCGRFRVSLAPNPFADPSAVRQELVLRTGSVALSGRGLRGRVWVEVNQPVIHVDLDTDSPSTMTAAYESWRTQTRLVPLTLDANGKPSSWDRNRWSAFGYFWYRGDVFSHADHIGFSDPGAVEFAHQNNNQDLLFDKEVRLEGLAGAADRLANPTRDRIFGGEMTGDGLASAGNGEGVYAGAPYRSWRLRSLAPVRHHHLRIFLHTERQQSLGGWRSGLSRFIADRVGSDHEAWNEDVAWWNRFWKRSHVVIDRGKGAADVGWRIGRNYQLFRYQLACNAHGRWPTRFNGGLFTFDPLYVDGTNGSSSFVNPDFRAWGAWTGQNQRLVYWPMLKNGDDDMIRSEFEFYRRNLPNAVARTRQSWGIDGASFGEQIDSGGLPLGSHYGWEPPYGDRDPKREVGVANLHSYYYTSQLEMAFMIHEYYRYTGADISAYLPFLKGSVAFFFEYYQMLERRRDGRDWDASGKLVIDPSHALETYAGKNPADVICALRVNLAGLLALPDSWVSPGERKLYRDWLGRLPDLSYRERDGRRTIAPVQGASGPILNYEIPQLYPVFPYGLFGLGLPGLQLARDTWLHGVDACLGPDPWTAPRPGDKPWYPSRVLWFGWTQQAIWMARLGFTSEARDYVVKKLDDARGGNEFDTPARRRFPSFWGPGFDWTPDHNWGGSGMIALQEMLLQTPGNRLLLLPSWPRDWDVDFKLHAPNGTVVMCDYRDGKVINAEAFPKSRERDFSLLNISANPARVDP